MTTTTRLVAMALALATMMGLIVLAARYVVRRGPALASTAENWATRWSRRHPALGRMVVNHLVWPRNELLSVIVWGIVLAAAVWLFLGIVEDVVNRDPLVEFDVATYRALQHLRTGAGDSLMIAVTEFGDALPVAAVTVAVLLWLLAHRAWHTAGYWLAAVSLSSVVNTAIQRVIHRFRPVPDLYSGLTSFSFPSGHSTVNAVMYGLILILAMPALPPRWRVPSLSVAAGLVALIALSRLYLGAHWLSDVAGGLAFAVSWLAVLAIAYLRRPREDIHARGLLVVACATLAAAGTFNVSRNGAADATVYRMRGDADVPLVAKNHLARTFLQLPVPRVGVRAETMGRTLASKSLALLLQPQAARSPQTLIGKGSIFNFVGPRCAVRVPLVPCMTLGTYDTAVSIE